MADQRGLYRTKPQATAEPEERPIRAAFGWFVLLSIGFGGLHYLIDERPEFVGPPLRYQKALLVQDSPRIAVRRQTDDVSVVDEISPSHADVRFDLQARTDARGLRLVQDLSGKLEAHFTVSNPWHEPMFVLFRFPHPRADSDARRAGEDSGSVVTKALALEADGPGSRETSANAWFWSGTVPPGAERKLDVTYETAGITGVEYRVAANRDRPIQDHRLTIRVAGVDELLFDSKGGGGKPGADDSAGVHSMTWERKDFLPPEEFHADVPEGRSLHVAIKQLIQMGPLVMGLFLITMVSLVRVRRRLTGAMVQTMALTYFFYFPLVLYLSVRLPFALAVALAALIPGSLLVNYLRILLGPTMGLVGAPVLLAIYQIFPTLAAFGAWNRGLVLLSCGLVTLAVLIDLQNRALRELSAPPSAPAAPAPTPGAVAASALIVMLILTWPARSLAADAGERAQSRGESPVVSVTLPASLVPAATDAAARPPEPMLASYGVARYGARLAERYVEVHASLPVEVLRAGTATGPIFRGDVPLVSRTLPEGTYLSPWSNDLALASRAAGKGSVELVYRAPLVNAGERVEVELPLLVNQSGVVEVTVPSSHVEVTNGAIWDGHPDGEGTRVQIGVTGRAPVTLRWTTGSEGADETDKATAASGVVPRDGVVYGIRVLNSDQLTVVHSDGTCTHFAAFELPADHPDVFEVSLPKGGEIISTVVDAREVERPTRDGDRYVVQLGPHAHRDETRVVSLRLSLPPAKLGFLGAFDVELPAVDTTVGATRWTIAVPSGFRTRVLSSGMDELGGTPPLDGFGDYGRALTGRRMIVLGKTLAPPSHVRATIRYFQQIDETSTDLESMFPQEAGAAPQAGAIFNAPFFQAATRGRRG